MPDHDDRPEPDLTLEAAPPTEPAPPPEVSWHNYKLRKLGVSVALVADKYCRVSELGEGYIAVEVEGLEPMITEEQFAICQEIAARSAVAGRSVRRVVDRDGEAVYQ